MEITDMFSYEEYKEIIQIIKESGRTPQVGYLLR